VSARALRRLEADIQALLNEPEGIDREALALIARRLTAQAEMLEEGIGE